MKCQKTFSIVALVCSAAVISACASDPASPPQEFIATSADFAGFTAWAETTPSRVGPDPMSVIGGAHEAGDTTIHRWMYIKQATAVRGSDGQFPIGTIIVKDMRKNNAGVFTSIAAMAMAKRGNGFNSAGKGWEWFVLGTDGSITARGGSDLMSGACNGCHGAAQDNVFTK